MLMKIWGLMVSLKLMFRTVEDKMLRNLAGTKKKAKKKLKLKISLLTPK